MATFGTLPTTVGVQLVEHQEFETLAVLDHLSVEWLLPGEQKLQHHEIGQQDIGGRFGDSFAGLVGLLTVIAGELH